MTASKTATCQPAASSEARAGAIRPLDARKASVTISALRPGASRLLISSPRRRASPGALSMRRTVWNTKAGSGSADIGISPWSCATRADCSEPAGRGRHLRDRPRVDPEAKTPPDPGGPHCTRTTTMVWFSSW